MSIGAFKGTIPTETLRAVLPAAFCLVVLTVLVYAFGVASLPALPPVCLDVFLIALSSCLITAVVVPVLFATSAIVSAMKSEISPVLGSHND